MYTESPLIPDAVLLVHGGAARAAAPPPASAAASKLELAGELLVTLLLAVVVAAVGLSGVFPPSIPFVEREPAISFPVFPQTISLTLLVVISLGIPLAIILAAAALRWAMFATAARGAPVSVRAQAAYAGWALLALAQALLLCQATTNCIKISVGKPRPNFFALCDYKGYALALAAQNFTEYNAATVAGALGDSAYCTGTAAHIIDAQSSFPSGHASLSAAGMLFTVLYLRHLAALPPRRFFTALAMLVAVLPIALAIGVSVTRVRDRWHDPIDVLFGSLIGAATAYIAFAHFEATGRSALLPRGNSAEGKALVAPAVPGG